MLYICIYTVAKDKVLNAHKVFNEYIAVRTVESLGDYSCSLYSWANLRTLTALTTNAACGQTAGFSSLCNTPTIKLVDFIIS